MPALSPTMEKGNIAEWAKKEGDAVSEGDVLATIETDKSTMAWEVLEEGYVAKILKPDGSEDVAVGEVVAVMVEEEADVAAFADRVFASPAARKLAAESGIDVSTLTATGARITKSDVEAAIGAAAPAAGAPSAAAARVPSAEPGQSYVDVPHTQIRRITAARLCESKQTVPHYYLTADVRMDRVAAMRAELKEAGIKVSVNDFVMKAAAMALMDVPGVNAQWTDDATRMFSSADISVAVQTDHGLMVPIVTGCEAKRVSEISAKVRELAGKAKANKLLPEEFTGGTFTISNLGMYGVKHFAAIINPPQAAILAVGGSEARLVPTDCERGFATQHFMHVTLSLDHRVVDGAMGAEWLQAFKRHIEAPAAMLA
eukprot:PRCOL_00005279-RA